MLAIIILVVGIVLLLKELGVVAMSWGLFWAIVLIIVGLKMLFIKKHNCMMCDWFGHNGKMCGHDHNHE